jgi:uncharacterized membrane protein HdeD (DUF308 family)
METRPQTQTIRPSGPESAGARADAPTAEATDVPRQPMPGALMARLWWLVFARGVVALALGLSVLLSSARRPGLANFIGIYWLVGAALTLRWALSTRWRPGSRLALVAGLAGAVAAISTLLRSALSGWISPAVFVNVLAASILIVGIMRVAGVMRDDQLGGDHPRLRHRLLIGTLDVGLGVLLLVSPPDSRAVSLGAAVWALVGGTVLVLDARALRQLGRPRTARPKRAS